MAVLSIFFSDYEITPTIERTDGWMDHEWMDGWDDSGIENFDDQYVW